jgi:hypothetical protein
MCADYRRKLTGASAQTVRFRQEQDVAELLERRADWAVDAAVSVYRCEIDRNLAMRFHCLEAP